MCLVMLSAAPSFTEKPNLICAVKAKAEEHGLSQPYLLIEPGRSIVGEAGVTLYTVGAIKEQ